MGPVPTKRPGDGEVFTAPPVPILGCLAMTETRDRCGRELLLYRTQSVEQ